ncbi:hypothetical protein MUK42_12451, partial [Musa troglodytarum]
MTGGDQPSRLLYELCALLLEVLRTPHLAPPPADAPSRPPADAATARRRVPTRMSPARFASLLLGASLALMLCGSVTFLIGFILMPWVVGLVILFYFVGIVSNLPGLGRAILCPASGPSSPKQMSVRECSVAALEDLFVAPEFAHKISYKHLGFADAPVGW